MSDLEEIRLALSAEEVRALHKILTAWLDDGFATSGKVYDVAVRLRVILGACTAVKGQTP